MQRTPYSTNNSEVRDIIATDMLTGPADSCSTCMDGNHITPLYFFGKIA
jgi:hypothetical protein